MSGDFARWLENETAAALIHDAPGHPADCSCSDCHPDVRPVVLENSRKRTEQLFAWMEDPEWLGI